MIEGLSSEARMAQLFVAVLGASNHTYARPLSSIAAQRAQNCSIWSTDVPALFGRLKVLN